MTFRPGSFMWPTLLGLTVLQGGSDTTRSETARPWRLVNGHHWQVVEAEPAEDVPDTDAREGTRGACPEGMVDVEGSMKVDGAVSIEELQKTTCTDWIDPSFPERCATFDRDAWRERSERLPTRPMRFCMDRFEYPNQLGAYPVIEVTWRESAALCADEGKRLCTESEWTFACEGDEATPYPTGYVRDPEACVIDRPWRDVHEQELVPRESRVALLEIDRLWQGEASGARPACRSSFGVYDLTGNVDEWTSSVRPGERPSILKGGYWGPVRARCRPSTRAHDEDYSYYQEGFRCCRDIP
jgi:formylglycine-generating enzyme